MFRIHIAGDCHGLCLRGPVCVRVYVCVRVCASAHVPQSPAVRLFVSLCSRLFSHASQSQSHRRPGLFLMSRGGSLLLSVQESDHPRGQGFRCLKPQGLRVPVEACCPQPPSCHPWVGTTMAVPLLPTGSCRAWPAPGAPCVRRAARAAPLRSPLPLRRHLRRVGY